MNGFNKKCNFAHKIFYTIEMGNTLNFIDLFSGAGGLSEGFIRAGYTSLAHIEMDKYACDTLKTRAAFYYTFTYNKDL
jgi:16S rRNA A1518/A1519 N6-dimethyltransferase RsmA/KsgA/DIM1 with predicted DNA glycosylase/AP lyase activity